MAAVSRRLPAFDWLRIVPRLAAALPAIMIILLAVLALVVVRAALGAYPP
jgi:hypothetical protein